VPGDGPSPFNYADRQLDMVVNGGRFSMPGDRGRIERDHAIGDVLGRAVDWDTTEGTPLAQAAVTPAR
jgi:hypothetical protein